MPPNFWLQSHPSERSTETLFSGGLPARRTVGRTWIIWSGVDWLRDRCRTGYNVVASPEVAMRTLVLRTIGGDRADLPHAGAVEMWLRTSAVSEIGFLVGVDRRNSRTTPST